MSGAEPRSSIAPQGCKWRETLRPASDPEKLGRPPRHARPLGRRLLGIRDGSRARRSPRLRGERHPVAIDPALPRHLDGRSWSPSATSASSTAAVSASDRSTKSPAWRRSSASSASPPPCSSPWPTRPCRAASRCSCPRSRSSCAAAGRWLFRTYRDRNTPRGRRAAQARPRLRCRRRRLPARDAAPRRTQPGLPGRRAHRRQPGQAAPAAARHPGRRRPEALVSAAEELGADTVILAITSASGDVRRRTPGRGRSCGPEVPDPASHLRDDRRPGRAGQHPPGRHHRRPRPPPDRHRPR